MCLKWKKVISKECFLGSDVCLQYEQCELKLYESNVIIESVVFIKYNI